MTRVLHVVEAYGGGVETALQSYVGALPDDEHLLLARTRRPHATRCVQALFSEVHLVDTTLLGLYRELLVACRRLRPDVVHAHSSYAGALARLLPPSSPPVVYSPHCYCVERSDVSAGRRRLLRQGERLLGRRPCVVAALSPHEARLARDLSPASAVYLVPNTAPVVQRARHWHPGRPLHIVTVGRVSTQKDPSYCAQVARLLALEVRWTWIGDGDEHLVRELRDSGVDVTGWLGHQQVQQSLAEADLMVHTAAWEGSPMTLLEGLACGLAVLVRALPSLDSLRYSPAGSTPAATAEAVRLFMTDPETRAVVYAAGDAVLRDATTEVQRRALERCYRAATGDRPALPAAPQRCSADAVARSGLSRSSSVRSSASTGSSSTRGSLLVPPQTNPSPLRISPLPSTRRASA